MHESTSPESLGEWSAQGQGVLLVDDEEAMLGMATLMLEHLGFTVYAAGSGLDALALYQAHQNNIALVLLDLNMPYMGGEETLIALRAVNPEVLAIVSSGYTEQKVAPRFKEAPPAAFIQKPYSLAELQQAVKGLLA